MHFDEVVEVRVSSEVTQATDVVGLQRVQGAKPSSRAPDCGLMSNSPIRVACRNSSMLSDSVMARSHAKASGF